jgi:hypothetical protein
MAVKKIKNGINVETNENHRPKGFDSLSDREKKYFKMMNAKSGVLYIQAPPGYAKSAIMRSIANKIGYQYFDIRLSMVDETDVGLFPAINDVEITIDGEKKVQKMLEHVAPKWAYMANEKPSIIHFEELNRSTLAVRNAALQILLEREIGAFFKFNNNVLMCSSGNLGEEDGTDVEEFDQALNNRLIHFEHQLPYPEWVEQYANENVCPVIVQFLKTHTEHYYKKPDQRNQRNKAYATPRSWTFLSDYIFENFGEWVDKTDPRGNPIKDDEGNVIKIKKFANIRKWIKDIKEIGHGYVGASNARFIRYCEDTLKITLDDVLNRFDELENDIKEFNRDKKSELLANMKERKISSLKAPQKENLVKFILTISDDEIVGYLLHVLDVEYTLSEDTRDNKEAEKFLADKRFLKYRDVIMKHVDDEKS